MSIDQGTIFASIELRLDKLESNFKKAEADFKTFGDRIQRKSMEIGRSLESVGRNFSVGLTAPIGLLGAAAFRSSMQMDTMKRSLESVAGSSKEAERQLSKLRETAKLPGLGEIEAVSGATQLEAAGLKFAVAEKALRGFGGALSQIGKGKDELAHVNEQLSQMIGKGKVMQEDLRIVQSFVPQLRAAMKAAFGTSNTADIERLGIGPEEFISRISDQLLKLPAASGGIRNSLENLQDSGRRAFAAIGDSITPVVSRLIDTLLPTIESIGAAFRALPSSVQTVMVGSGGIAALAGIAALGIGKLITTVTELGAAFRALQAANLGASLAGFLTNPVTVAVAAVVLLAGGIYLLTRRTEENTQASIDAARAEEQNTRAKGETQKLVHELLHQYDDLNQKTNRNAEENKKLQELLNKIGAMNPGLVTGFNDQGNAIGLVADAYQRATDQAVAFAEAADKAAKRGKALAGQQIADQRSAIEDEIESLKDLLRTKRMLVPEIVDVPRSLDNPTGPTRPQATGRYDRVPATADALAVTAARLRELEQKKAELEGRWKAVFGGRGQAVGPAGVKPPDAALTDSGRFAALQQGLEQNQKEQQDLNAKIQAATTNTQRNALGEKMRALLKMEANITKSLQEFDPAYQKQQAEKATREQEEYANVLRRWAARQKTVEKGTLSQLTDLLKTRQQIGEAADANIREVISAGDQLAGIFQRGFENANAMGMEANPPGAGEGLPAGLAEQFQSEDARRAMELVGEDFRRAFDKGFEEANQAGIASQILKDQEQDVLKGLGAGLKQHTNEFASIFKEMMKGLQRDVAGVFANFFENVLSGKKNPFQGFLDAFRQTLIRMAAELAASELMKLIVGLFGGGKGGAAGKGAGGAGGAAGMAGLAGLGSGIGFFAGGPAGAAIGGAASAIVGGLGSIFGFADGGFPPIGRASLVGEHGPELIVPRVPSLVIPNHQLAAAGAGGAGGININVSMPGMVVSRDMDVDRLTHRMTRALADKLSEHWYYQQRTRQGS